MEQFVNRQLSEFYGKFSGIFVFYVECRAERVQKDLFRLASRSQNDRQRGFLLFARKRNRVERDVGFQSDTSFRGKNPFEDSLFRRPPVRHSFARFQTPDA